MNRSERAEAILKDELFVSIVKELEERHVKAMVESGPGQTITRETHYQAIRALREIMAELSVVAQEKAVTDFNNRLRSKRK